MSIVPMLYSDWWEDLERPHRLFDQHFGHPVDPEEILHRNRHADNLGYPFFRRMRRRYHPFHHALGRRPNNKSATIGHSDKDKFLVTLDVKQFAPDEITVKTVERSVVVVEAKHEEKEDEHGYISRQFTRKYVVPSNYDIEQIETFLSSDGVLTITAPKKKGIGENMEKVIKIQYTGEPAILDQPTSKSIDAQADPHEQMNRDNSQHRPGQMNQHQRGKKMNVKGA